jgi:alpha-amylase
MKTIKFVFGIHNHQPIGNFEAIFEEAYQKAYLPFLEVLAKHHSIKVTFHFSGILLEWIVGHHPEFISIVKNLLQSGQIELMTGGYYEPIMVMLYDRDSIGQIIKLSQYIRGLFNYEPKGMWLAERVWEPHLAKPISEAGVEYTIVDDLPFKSAGLFEEELFGYYLTEEQGHPLKIFPINEKLRFLIPFQPVEEVISYFKSQATEKEETLAIMADDGEKFGIWPGTNELVYRQNWLEQFFSELEKNREWIKTFTFSEYISEFPPKGRIYLPTGSYSQMMEWVLPTRARKEFTDIQREIKKLPQSERYARFLKGGFWRNFFVKYPESNWMQKKMLLVSKKIFRAFQNLHAWESSDNKRGNKLSVKSKKQIIEPPDWLEKARDELWKGQCNCAYWHGVFGGLYFPHLRKAVYTHLINAEKIVDDKSQSRSQWMEKQEFDFDLDGRPEVLVSTSLLNAYFRPSAGASLFELDYKPQNVNFLTTLTRRKETYHEEIIRASLFNSRPNLKNKNVKSIHNMEKVKDKSLTKYLHYDWYERVSLVDHFLHPDTKIADFSNCQYGEQGDFVDQPYAYRIEPNGVGFVRDGFVWAGDFQQPVRVEKKVIVSVNQAELLIIYRIVNKGENPTDLWFGSEFNFSFSSPEDKGCYYYVPNVEGRTPFSSTEEILNLKEMGMYDEGHRVNIAMEFNPLCSLWHFPIETVSEGDAAYERMYQESVVFPHWKLNLTPKEAQAITLKLKIADI